MKNRTSQVLFGYWNDVRGDRMAPGRFEIEPSRIAPILPETFILERIDSGVFRFRLAGTRICEQFGRELRGENFVAFFANDEQRLIERDLGQISAQGGVGHIVIEATTATDKKVEFELLLLPLVHTHQVVNRILGAASPLAQPPWLGHERLTVHRLISHDLIWPAGRRHAIAERMSAPPPAALATPNARIVAANRRTFRVYEGGLGKGTDSKH